MTTRRNVMQSVQIFVIGGAAIALTAGGVALGYWLHPDTSAQPAATAAKASAEPLPPKRKPIYYQDPSGGADYSPTPKKTAAGRDYVPVYDESSAAPSPDASAHAVPTDNDPGRVLYYRNPMGLADTSPVPKKDSMGMDYIPVHEGDDDTGLVSVSPARIQMLGVRTAPVQIRSGLVRSVRATGVIQADESKIVVVTTKFDSVVEHLYVNTTGADVRAGQPLARVWIQTPDTQMQTGPDVITRQIAYVIALQEKDPGAIARAARILREYGLPESTLADIRRTGRATRSVTVTAPRTGTVLEKPAIEGMRFDFGSPLYKIGDLSSVWLMTDVAEQDIGSVRIGAPARVTFVAFPERTFHGVVSFIYPSLMVATRTGRVRIVLSNAAALLHESMYATVIIDTPASMAGPTLVVPDSAIIDSGARQVVLVAKGQGKFEPRTVRIGARGDGVVQVLDGLKPNEQVVTGANFLIDAESNLRAALQAFKPADHSSGPAE